MNNGKCKIRKQQFIPGRRQPTSIKGRLPLSHALRVKCAEYWMTLGEADQALRELEALPQCAWNHLWAVKVRVAALKILQERTGAIVQEGSQICE
jgi:hypothetical protein